MKLTSQILSLAVFFVSFNSFALTVRPGHYLGTLHLGDKPTGKQCHVHVESETANSSGADCFDYIVSSKDLNISKLKFVMRRDVIAGDNSTRCSKFVLPSFEANKEHAYLTDQNDDLTLFINRKTGFLRSKVTLCRGLTYIKDN